METQNANPTILSISDLPSRRQQQKKTAPSALLTGLTPAYARDPFATSAESASEDESEDDSVVERIDEQEIYGNFLVLLLSAFNNQQADVSADLIATISDPEHPLTLGELAVINLPHIQVTDEPSSLTSRVLVELTPTVNHCSLATVIGLGVRVRLEQALPPRFRLDVRIREGTHSTGAQVNKQLNDKERVASALENETLMGVVRKMLETCK